MPRHYPHWLKSYMEYTRAAEAPNSFHFWTGVSTIAGALRRRIWRDEHLFQWTPNFYIILVGPAGFVTKSTSIDLGMNLLRQVPDIKFGPESLTWQALGESFQEAQEYVDWQENGTPKPFKMSALTIPISELGTFLTVDDTKFVSFLTTMWDGREHPFMHKTRTQELISIERPWLNVIGATTPTWIRNNIPDNMIGEGLMSRIVFIYADKKRQLTAYPSRVVKGQAHHDHEQKLVEDLTRISLLKGKIELSNEALAWGEDWYIKHHEARPTHLASERFGGYLARKQGHMHKLAMILSVSKRSTLVIEKEDLEEANLILTEAEGSMIRVFESMGVVDEAKRVAELLAFVRVYKWITPQELYRLCHNTMSQQDFTSSLRSAVESELFKIEVKDGKRGVSLSRTVH